MLGSSVELNETGKVNQVRNKMVTREITHQDVPNLIAIGVGLDGEYGDYLEVIVIESASRTKRQ